MWPCGGVNFHCVAQEVHHDLHQPCGVRVHHERLGSSRTSKACSRATPLAVDALERVLSTS
jgi:hypothetical protein